MKHHEYITDERIIENLKVYRRENFLRKFNLMTISILYSVIMICIIAMIYGSQQQKMTSNVTISYTRPYYTVSFDPQGGGVSPSSKQVKLGDNYGDLPTPTKTGYSFRGWTKTAATKDESSDTWARNLIEKTTFTGSNYIALGRENYIKYTKKLTVTVVASMDNWADFATNKMALVSCTQSGGWGFDADDGSYVDYMTFGIYDGSSYKDAVSSISLSSMSSGYHTFVGTFDGSYARLYIDGVLVGTSEKCSSNTITYNSTNGIFVGAEAGSNTTTPDGNYFVGTIDYVSITGAGTEDNKLIEKTTFTGSNYIALGRDYMYTNELKVTAVASMDNWADFATNKMALVSCTQSGGWGFDADDGSYVDYMTFGIYDGSSYKDAVSSISLSSMSSGYHTFVGTFDGSYARLYIDGVLVGTSEKCSSNTITYNSTNGIFVGAEAGSNTTTPEGNYFVGTIDSVMIENDSTFPTEPVVHVIANSQNTTLGDHTLTANWAVNTYTITLDRQSGSGGSSSVTVTYDQIPSNISVPSRSGYYFGGYFTGTGGSGTQYFGRTGAAAYTWDIASNTTLYACWISSSSSATLSSDWKTTLSLTASSVKSIVFTSNSSATSGFAGSVSVGTNVTAYYNSDKTSIVIYSPYLISISDSRYFYRLSSLTTLKLDNINTEILTDMSSMFKGCSSLTSLNVSNFDTSQVVNMSNMFYDCSSLTSLNVSNFNTANVTNMGNMFCGCSSLTSLNLGSNFNTQNVKYIDNMFNSCSKLTTLNVSNFNTGNARSMASMFRGCSSLTSLDVSNFNTQNTKYMENMFNGCSGLTSLNLGGFNLSVCTNFTDMLTGCSALTSITLPYNLGSSYTITLPTSTFYNGTAGPYSTVGSATSGTTVACSTESSKVTLTR